MKLLNASSRVRTFNLEAAFFREQHGGLPGSLTLAPRERADVPDQAIECHEVAAAIEAGGLRIVSESKAEAPAVRRARKGDVEGRS